MNAVLNFSSFLHFCLFNKLHVYVKETMCKVECYLRVCSFILGHHSYDVDAHINSQHVVDPTSKK